MEPIPNHVPAGLMRSAAMAGQGQRIPVDATLNCALVGELEEHRRQAAIHQPDPKPNRERAPGP
jgi:hypothetical protein